MSGVVSLFEVAGGGNLRPIWRNGGVDEAGLARQAQATGRRPFTASRSLMKEFLQKKKAQAIGYNSDRIALWAQGSVAFSRKRCG